MSSSCRKISYGWRSGTTAKLATVVGDHRIHSGFVLLEERQDIVVQDVYGGHRELGRVQPGPGVAAVTVDDSLHVHAPDSFERAHMERIHAQELTGVCRLDVAVSELGAEAFQQSDLLVAEPNPLLPDMSLV